MRGMLRHTPQHNKGHKWLTPYSMVKKAFVLLTLIQHNTESCSRVIRQDKEIGIQTGTE